tara:strand:- start:290 stop:640 length:351 start_codon:yes stop_codon:yes gene_type:complete
MTKKEIVDSVYDRTTLNKKEASTALDAIISSITSSLAGGEKVEIRDFCSFTVRERSSHISRNPRSGQRIQVPPKKVPYFRPGKKLKEMVNYKETESIDTKNINNANSSYISSLRSL